jgi:hypothetical protein
MTGGMTVGNFCGQQLISDFKVASKEDLECFQNKGMAKVSRGRCARHSDLTTACCVHMLKCHTASHKYV